MIAVTGANGYVGGRILAHLRARGIEALALVRRPAAGDRLARRYALGDALDPRTLDGIEAVVHAAYDLSARGAQVREINFLGSLPLLDALAERGGRVVLISSLAAHRGARSDYGRVKLELEEAVLSRGGVALRPGLVFGVRAAGMFGAMVRALARRSVAPMVGGGEQRLFLTYDERLCELVAALVAASADGGASVMQAAQGQDGRRLFAAHEVPSTLRGLAEAIAAAHGRRLIALPVPAPVMLAGLRSAEGVGLSLPFRADSLCSLLNPIPLDQVSELARAGVEFPPLSRELWMTG